MQGSELSLIALQMTVDVNNEVWDYTQYQVM